MEVHTQLKNALGKIERKNNLINYPLIQSTLIISVMNVMVGNQIRASYVDQKIILLIIFRNWALWIRKFTIIHKSLKLVRTDNNK